MYRLSAMNKALEELLDEKEEHEDAKEDVDDGAAPRTP